ncbi:Protein of unknown function [Leuconostoc citreum LBAE C11]|nr:Protein of unknown function [Leuconostoc citreum LBAE C11]
MFALERVYIII